MKVKVWWCPLCRDMVSADEDGCCSECGRDCDVAEAEAVMNGVSVHIREKPGGAPVSDPVSDKQLQTDTTQEGIDQPTSDPVAEAREWLAESERIGEALTDPGEQRQDTEAMRHVRALLEMLEPEGLCAECGREARDLWSPGPRCGFCLRDALDRRGRYLAGVVEADDDTIGILVDQAEFYRQAQVRQREAARWKDGEIARLRGRLTLATEGLQEIEAATEAGWHVDVVETRVAKIARQTLARITEKEAAMNTRVRLSDLADSITYPSDATLNVSDHGIVHILRKRGLITTDSEGTWVNATEILRLVEEGE